MEDIIADKFPMTLLAQLDEVSIFQTAALQDIANIDTTNPLNTQLLTHEQASYGALNLGLHVQDNAAQVLNNRISVLKAINHTLANHPQKAQHAPIIKSLHWVNQVHGKQCHDVDTTAFTMHPIDADAQFSKQPDIGLAMMTADCVPLVLYQPKTRQIAAIHAGWQGLACGVIKATAERFSGDGQILAWIGVCISQAHYEVGIEIYEQLRNGCLANHLLSSAEIDQFMPLFCAAVDDTQNNCEKNRDKQSSAHQPLQKITDKSLNISTVKTAKLKVNLPKIAADQLKYLGITLANDSLIGCSYADTRYYSYRRQTHLQQPATGRMALIIVRHTAISR